MKVLVAADAHIFETPDGKYWTPAIYDYNFWKRYMNVYDSVRIAARTKKVEKPTGKALRVDGPGVEIFPLPFYQGPKQLAKVYFKTIAALRNVEKGCDAAILRMPGQTAYMVYEKVKGKLPIGGEIVYDPSDDLKRKDGNMLIKIMRKIISERLKKFCRNANGVSYVTKAAIQKNYPSAAQIKGENEQYFETYYSTITLSDKAFSCPKQYKNKSEIKVAFSNVSMNSHRKGEPVLIKAIALARNEGCNVSAVLIGDGTKRKDFERYAEELNVGGNIKFTGRLASAEEVREILAECDMFVFPSQAEGLPRGILEAMAQGLPVLSTPVGGIPEVIDRKYLFDPHDSSGFAEMIVKLYHAPEELERMSAENFAAAKQFKNEILQKRRDEFYKKLSKVSQKGSKK